MPRIPLIDDLTTDPVSLGSSILVEFDPSSLWFVASLTIAARWLRDGGLVSYNDLSQSPESIRMGLKRLGLDTDELETAERLIIWDSYTETLGLKTKEPYWASLKVADLSISYVKSMTAGLPSPSQLVILDNVSTYARFNDDRAWVEFLLSRAIPSVTWTKSIGIGGLVRGLHSDWVYRQLETAVDSVIDFKLEEQPDGKTQDLIRIRKMRNATFTPGWHRLKLGENFEVTLEK